MRERISSHDSKRKSFTRRESKMRQKKRKAHREIPRACDEKFYRRACIRANPASNSNELLGKRYVGLERYRYAILKPRAHYHGPVARVDLQIMYFSPVRAVLRIVGNDLGI